MKKSIVLAVLALTLMIPCAAMQLRDIPWQTINWKAVLKEHKKLRDALKRGLLEKNDEFDFKTNISELITARDTAQKTLLHHIAIQHLGNLAAFGCEKREVMKAREMAMTLLVEFGADVDARDAAGATPLHRAALEGETFSINVLLDLGADINARSTTDSTPLHCAVSYGNKDATALLLERGADIYAKRRDGNTPLDLVKKRNCYHPDAEVTALVQAHYQKEQRPC